VTTNQRSAFGAVVLMALIGLTLGAPASVVACVCAGESEGDVVFTGKVVDSPNEHIMLHDIWVPNGGVYTFDVESVVYGDPLDGRVYSGPGNCNNFFEVGATYRVHAHVVEPGEESGNPPDVPLVTGLCMAGELLEPPAPLTAIGAWAVSLPGVLVLSAAGFALIVGSAAYLYWHRRSTETPLAAD
jgi:hypothetical protein